MADEPESFSPNNEILQNLSVPSPNPTANPAVSDPISMITQKLGTLLNLLKGNPAPQVTGLAKPLPSEVFSGAEPPHDILDKAAGLPPGTTQAKISIGEHAQVLDKLTTQAENANEIGLKQSSDADQFSELVRSVTSMSPQPTNGFKSTTYGGYIVTYEHDGGELNFHYDQDGKFSGVSAYGKAGNEIAHPLLSEYKGPYPEFYTLDPALVENMNAKPGTIVKSTDVLKSHTEELLNFESSMVDKYFPFSPSDKDWHAPGLDELKAKMSHDELSTMTHLENISGFNSGPSSYGLDNVAHQIAPGKSYDELAPEMQWKAWSQAHGTDVPEVKPNWTFYSNNTGMYSIEIPTPDGGSAKYDLDSDGTVMSQYITKPDGTDKFFYKSDPDVPIEPDLSPFADQLKAAKDNPGWMQKFNEKLPSTSGFAPPITNKTLKPYTHDLEEFIHEGEVKPEESKAIQYYSVGSTALNKYLAKGKDAAYISDEHEQKIHDVVKNFDSLFSRARSPKPTVTYRGFVSHDLWNSVRSVPVGGTINFKSYVSSSFSPGTARAFASTSDQVAKIISPEGAPIIPFGAHSDLKSEDEILINRNSTFRVIQNDHRGVTLELIHPPTGVNLPGISPTEPRGGLGGANRGVGFENEEPKL